MPYSTLFAGLEILTLVGDSSDADRSMEILVREWPNLQSVSIHISKCTDITLGLLIQHPEIKEIRLCGSNISGDYMMLPLSVPINSAIKVLDLSRCEKLSDAGILGPLSKCGGTLKVLNISFTNVSLENLETLADSLSVLEELNLEGCYNLSDFGLITFLNKTGATLKILNINNTRVTLLDIEILTTSLPVLENLNLGECEDLTDSGIIACLNKSGRTLRFLDLSHTRVTFSDIGPLTTSFPVLEVMNLSYCDNMKYSRIITLLNRTGGALRLLDLSRTRESFSDVGSLTNTFPLLEELNLKCCSNLTESGIIAFLNKTGGNLKILDLSVTGVSFSDIGALTTVFPVLENLNLSVCNKMTNSGIISFLNKSGGKLKILNVGHTRVSFSDIGALIISFPMLEELNLRYCKKVTDSKLIGFLRKTRGDLGLCLKGSSVNESNIHALFTNLKFTQN